MTRRIGRDNPGQIGDDHPHERYLDKRHPHAQKKKAESSLQSSGYAPASKSTLKLENPFAIRPTLFGHKPVWAPDTIHEYLADVRQSNRDDLVAHVDAAFALLDDLLALSDEVPVLPASQPTMLLFGSTSAQADLSLREQTDQALDAGNADALIRALGMLFEQIQTAWMALSDTKLQADFLSRVHEVIGYFTEAQFVVSAEELMASLDKIEGIKSKLSPGNYNNIRQTLLMAAFADDADTFDKIAGWVDEQITQIENDETLKRLEAKAAPLQAERSVYQQQQLDLLNNPPYTQSEVDVWQAKIDFVNKTLGPLEAEIFPLLKDAEERRWALAVQSQDKAKMQARIEVYLQHPELAPQDEKLQQYLEKITREKQAYARAISNVLDQINTLEGQMTRLDGQIRTARMEHAAQMREASYDILERPNFVVQTFEEDGINQQIGTDIWNADHANQEIMAMQARLDELSKKHAILMREVEALVWQRLKKSGDATAITAKIAYYAEYPQYMPDDPKLKEAVEAYQQNIASVYQEMEDYPQQAFWSGKADAALSLALSESVHKQKPFIEAWNDFYDTCLVARRTDDDELCATLQFILGSLDPDDNTSGRLTDETDIPTLLATVAAQAARYGLLKGYTAEQLNTLHVDWKSPLQDFLKRNPNYMAFPLINPQTATLPELNNPQNWIILKHDDNNHQVVYVREWHSRGGNFQTVNGFIDDQTLRAQAPDQADTLTALIAQAPGLKSFLNDVEIFLSHFEPISRLMGAFSNPATNITENAFEALRGLITNIQTLPEFRRIRDYLLNNKSLIANSKSILIPLVGYTAAEEQLHCLLSRIEYMDDLLGEGKQFFKLADQTKAMAPHDFKRWIAGDGLVTMVTTAAMVYSGGLLLRGGAAVAVEGGELLLATRTATGFLSTPTPVSALARAGLLAAPSSLAAQQLTTVSLAYLNPQDATIQALAQQSPTYQFLKGQISFDGMTGMLVEQWATQTAWSFATGQASRGLSQVAGRWMQSKNPFIKAMGNGVHHFGQLFDSVEDQVARLDAKAASEHFLKKWWGEMGQEYPSGVLDKMGGKAASLPFDILSGAHNPQAYAQAKMAKLVDEIKARQEEVAGHFPSPSMGEGHDIAHPPVVIPDVPSTIRNPGLLPDIAGDEAPANTNLHYPPNHTTNNTENFTLTPGTITIVPADALGIPLDIQDAAYQLSESNGRREVSLKRGEDNTWDVRLGEEITTDTVETWAVGDETDGGVVQNVYTLEAHLHPGLPVPSYFPENEIGNRGDLEIFAALALKNPGRVIRQVVLGYDATGNRAHVVIEARFVDGELEVAVGVLGNLGSAANADLRLIKQRMQALVADLQNAPNVDLDAVAQQVAASSPYVPPDIQYLPDTRLTTTEMISLLDANDIVSKITVMIQRLCRDADGSEAIKFCITGGTDPNASIDCQERTIYINFGLLALVQNDDELAYILSHELEHMHSQLQEQAKLMGGIQGAALNRIAEAEVDAKGVILRIKTAGYNPHASIQLLRRFAALAESGVHITHPHDNFRIDAIGAAIMGDVRSGRSTGFRTDDGTRKEDIVTADFRRNSEKICDAINLSVIQEQLSPTHVADRYFRAILNNNSLSMPQNVSLEFPYSTILNRSSSSSLFAYEFVARWERIKRNLPPGYDGAKSVELQLQLMVALDADFKRAQQEILGSDFSPKNSEQLTALLWLVRREVYIECPDIARITRNLDYYREKLESTREELDGLPFDSGDRARQTDLISYWEKKIRKQEADLEVARALLEPEGVEAHLKENGGEILDEKGNGYNKLASPAVIAQTSLRIRSIHDFYTEAASHVDSLEKVSSFVLLLQENSCGGLLAALQGYSDIYALQPAQLTQILDLATRLINNQSGWANSGWANSGWANSGWANLAIYVLSRFKGPLLEKVPAAYKEFAKIFIKKLLDETNLDPPTDYTYRESQREDQFTKVVRLVREHLEKDETCIPEIKNALAARMIEDLTGVIDTFNSSRSGPDDKIHNLFKELRYFGAFYAGNIMGRVDLEAGNACEPLLARLLYALSDLQFSREVTQAILWMLVPSLAPTQLDANERAQLQAALIEVAANTRLMQLLGPNFFYFDHFAHLFCTESEGRNSNFEPLYQMLIGTSSLWSLSGEHAPQFSCGKGWIVFRARFAKWALKKLVQDRPWDIQAAARLIRMDINTSNEAKTFIQNNFKWHLQQKNNDLTEAAKQFWTEFDQAAISATDNHINEIHAVLAEFYKESAGDCVAYYRGVYSFVENLPDNKAHTLYVKPSNDDAADVVGWEAVGFYPIYDDSLTTLQKEIGIRIDVDAIHKFLADENAIVSASLVDLLELVSIMIALGKGSSLSYELTTHFWNNKTDPNVRALLLNPEMISRISTAALQIKIAKWQLQESISGFPSKPNSDLQALPKAGEIRPNLREAYNLLKKQFPTPSGQSYQVTLYVEEMFLPNEAETNLLRDARPNGDNWVEMKGLGYADAPSYISDTIKSDGSRMNLLRFLIGQTTVAPDLGWVQGDKVKTFYERSYLPNGEVYQTAVLAQVLGDVVDVGSQVYNTVREIILADAMSNPALVELFDTYMGVVPEVERKILLANLLATFDPKASGVRSIKRLLEAAGPLGAKAAQNLVTSGVVTGELREDLMTSFDAILVPSRETVFNQLNEAFGDNVSRIVAVGRIVGSGSLNYVVEVYIQEEDGSTSKVCVRLQKENVSNQIQNEHALWETIWPKLEGSDNPQVRRYGLLIKGIADNAMQTLGPNGAELDLQQERKKYGQALTAYGQNGANPDTGLRIDVASPRIDLQGLVESGFQNKTSIYEYIDHVKLDKLADKNKQKKIAKQIVGAELAAIDKGTFDPDGHSGNWLIDLVNFRLVRVDYAQLTPISDDERALFKTTIIKLMTVNPEDLTVFLRNNFTDIFAVDEVPAGFDAALTRAFESLDYPGPASPLERLLFIQNQLEIYFAEQGQVMQLGLRNGIAKPLGSLLRLNMYRQYIGDDDYNEMLVTFLFAIPTDTTTTTAPVPIQAGRLSEISPAILDSYNYDDFDMGHRGTVFNQEHEFPNFFLPPEYRGQPSSAIPPQILADLRTDVEAALQSVFGRLMLPIEDPQNPGQIINVQYFSYLIGLMIDSEGNPIDETARIMPSGGVVRSAIGFIYERMYAGRLLGLNPREVLRMMADGKDFDVSGNWVDKPEIRATEIRGVGSDFDTLIICSPESFERIRQITLVTTASAESTYGARDVSTGIKKALFPIPDVKSYESQIADATSQGGATIDFLAFDPISGHFVEPPGIDGIVEGVLTGHYDYLAPQDDANYRNPIKQTIRGIRAMIELPFLTIADETRLRTELEQLRDDINGDKVDWNSSDAKKAVEQFDKTVRNSRFSGAHNRYLRARPGSIEALIWEVCQLIETKTKNSTLPEFVDSFPISKKDSTKVAELPVGAIISHDTFIDQYTNNGVLYHGTNRIENGMAMVRGGMFVSGGTKNQGKSACGTGGYTSSDRVVALGYAGSSGMVMDLKVKEDERMLVLNMEEAMKDPVFAGRVEVWKEAGLDPHQVLAREYGVDVIINGHVLIQNMEVIQIPTVGDLALFYRSAIEQTTSIPVARVKAYADFFRLYGYAVASGETSPLSPDELGRLREIVTKFLWSEGIQDINILEAYPWNFSDSHDCQLLADIIGKQIISGVPNDLVVRSYSLYTLKAGKLINTTTPLSLMRQRILDMLVVDKKLQAFFPWDFSEPIDCNFVANLIVPQLESGNLKDAIDIYRHFGRFLSSENTGILEPMVNIRKTILTELTKLFISGGSDVTVFYLFPWDFSNPEEVELFTKGFVQLPDVDIDPRYFSWDFDNPIHLKLMKQALFYNPRRGFRLFDSDNSLFTLAFTQEDHEKLRAISPVICDYLAKITSISISGSYSHGPRTSFGDDIYEVDKFYPRLFRKILQGASYNNLSAFEQQALDLAIEAGNSHIITILLNGHVSVMQYVVQNFKDNPERAAFPVFKLLALIQPNTSIVGLYHKSQTDLQNELDSDPEWAAKLVTALVEGDASYAQLVSLRENGSYYHLGDYLAAQSWSKGVDDLFSRVEGIRVEAELLENQLTDSVWIAEHSLEEVLDTRHRLLKLRHQASLADWYANGIVNYANGPVEVLEEYESSALVRNQVLKKLSEQFELNSVAELNRFNEEWNKTPRNPFFEIFLRLINDYPITNAEAKYLKTISDIEGAGSAWVAERLLNFKPDDDLTAFFFSGNIGAFFASIGDDSRFGPFKEKLKADILARIDNLPHAEWALDGFRVFPWNENDRSFLERAKTEEPRLAKYIDAILTRLSATPTSAEAADQPPQAAPNLANPRAAPETPTLTNLLPPAPAITQSTTPISVAEVLAGFGLNELALREAIPELADYLDWAEVNNLQISFTNEGEGVSHSLPNQQITINRNAAVLRGDPLLFVQTLVHEIKHHQMQVQWSHLSDAELLARVQQLDPSFSSVEEFWNNPGNHRKFFVAMSLESELEAYAADMQMAAQLQRFGHPGTILTATLPDGTTVTVNSQDFLTDPTTARANLATWLAHHQFTNAGRTVTYQQYYETMFDGWMRFAANPSVVQTPRTLANLMAAPTDCSARETAKQALINNGVMSSSDAESILEAIAQHVGDNTYGAYLNLPVALKACTDNNLDLDRTIKFLTDIAQHTGENGIGGAYEQLPVALKACTDNNLDLDRTIKFLTAIAQHVGDNTYGAYLNLPVALKACTDNNLDLDRTIKFLTAIAQHVGDNTYEAYLNLPVALKACTDNNLDLDRSISFLTDIAQNDKSGYAFSQLPLILGAKQIRLDILLKLLPNPINISILIYILNVRFFTRNILPSLKDEPDFLLALKIIDEAFLANVNTKTDVINTILALHSYDQYSVYITSLMDDSNFSATHPGVTKAHVFNQKINDADILVKLYLFAIKQSPEFLAENPTADHLIAHILGVPVEALFSNPNISTNTLSTIYALALNINFAGWETGVLSTYSFNANCFTANNLAKFVDFLQAFATLHALTGSVTQAVSTIDLKGDDISAANIRKLASDVKQNVVEKIKALLANKEADLQFTYDQLQDLENTWGSLESIYTLIARFNANPNWQPEIAMLARVFKASLDGNFKQLKFEGDKNVVHDDGVNDAQKAQAQLAGMNDAQKQTWITPRVAAVVADTNMAPDAVQVFQTQQVQTLSIQCTNTLAPHIKDALVDKTYPEKRITIDQLAAATDASALVGEVTKGIARNEKGTALWFAIVNLLEEVIASDRADKLDLFKKIKVLLKQADNSYSLDITQISSDITSFIRTVDQKPETKKEAILLTVLSHDPKLLLTVGDVVKGASSCQNYRTGSEIQTLLGYVVDANVQAMLSYAVTADDFTNSADYETVQTRLSNTTITFDGNKQIFTFTYTEAHETITIETKPLKTAYRRQMVKVGQTSAGAIGLVQETAYIQMHPHSAQMEAQLQEMFGALATDMKAATGQTITVPASRNPGGIYSDLSFGAHVKGYTISPPITQSIEPVTVDAVLKAFKLDIDKLTEAIPELAGYLDWAAANNLQVSFTNEGEGVSHSLPNQQITINRNAAVLRGDPLLFVQTLVHEIKHHQMQVQWSHLSDAELLARVQQLDPSFSSVEEFWNNPGNHRKFFVAMSLESELEAYAADMQMAAQLQRFGHPGTILTATLPDGTTVTVNSQDFLTDPTTARANLATWLAHHQFTNAGRTVTYQQYYETMFDGWMAFAAKDSVVQAPRNLANLMAAQAQSDTYKGIGIGSSNRPDVHIAPDNSYVVMDGPFGSQPLETSNRQIQSYGVSDRAFPKSNKPYNEDGLAMIRVSDPNVFGGEIMYQISMDGMGGTDQAHQAMQAALAYLTSFLQAEYTVEEALSMTAEAMRDDGLTGSVTLGIDKLTPQADGTVLLETWTYGDVRGVVLRPREGEVFRTHDASLVQFLRDMQDKGIALGGIDYNHISDWVDLYYPGAAEMKGRMLKLITVAGKKPTTTSVANDWQQGHHSLGYIVLTCFSANPLGRPHYQRFTLQPGDRYVRGSDGLWGNASADDVNLLIGEDAPEIAARALHANIKNNMEHGGADASPDNLNFIITTVAPFPQITPEARDAWLICDEEARIAGYKIQERFTLFDTIIKSAGDQLTEAFQNFPEARRALEEDAGLDVDQQIKMLAAMAVRGGIHTQQIYSSLPYTARYVGERCGSPYEVVDFFEWLIERNTPPIYWGKGEVEVLFKQWQEE